MNPNDTGVLYGYLLGVAGRELGDSTLDGNGEIAPPEDTDLLAQARVVVRRAVRRIVSERAWEWLFQTVTVSLVATAGADNIAADAARYRMPFWFNGVSREDFVYSGATAPLVRIEHVGPNVLANLQQRPSTGDPWAFAFRRLTASASQQPAGWELVCYPTPSTARTITFTAKAFPDLMSDEGHRFLAGSEYDRLIESAVLLEAAIEGRPDMIEMRRGEYADALRNAMNSNAETRPRMGGELSPVMPNALANGRESRLRGDTISRSFNGTPL